MTASGYAGALDLIAGDSVHAMHLVVNGHLVMRMDSLHAVVDSLAKLWAGRLHGVPIKGYQHLPMAMVSARAGDDATTVQHITALLSAPGISVEERAWVLASAVAIFLESDTLPTPVHIRTARTYYAQLQELPFESSVRERFVSLIGLMQAEAVTGELTQATQDGLDAYAFVGKTNNYDAKALMLRSGALVSLALLLSGQPHGIARIDSLVTALTPHVELPASLANDSLARYVVQDVRRDFFIMAKKMSFFGKPAPAYVATHWLNQPQPTEISDAAAGARVKPLNDGVIRIIAMGWFTCPWCVKEMHEFQKMLPHLPKGVELNYYEFTLGDWGGELVEPQEEAEHLRRYMLERKKYTYPITIWAGPKDSTPDGGRLPRKSPTTSAFAFTGGPTLVITDGHGIVRYYNSGYQKYEPALRAIVDYLVSERDHPGAVLAAPLSVPVASPGSNSPR